jgi:hypothetical protein
LWVIADPWYVQYAVGGGPVTLWSGREPVRPGMCFEVDLDGPRMLDRVALSRRRLG